MITSSFKQNQERLRGILQRGEFSSQDREGFVNEGCPSRCYLCRNIDTSGDIRVVVVDSDSSRAFGIETYRVCGECLSSETNTF